MIKGILLGGIIGGTLMFAWGAVSHMVLDIGGKGIKKLPNEKSVIESLHDDVKEDGLYAFPWRDDAAAESRTDGPSGLVVYHSADEGISPRRLGTELLTNIGCALLAGILLHKASGARFYPSRVVFVTMIGLVSWLSIEASYWNWYGFPREYTIGQLIDQVAGFAIAGLAVAACVKPKD